MPPTDIVDLLSEEHAMLRGLASSMSVHIGGAVGTSLSDAQVVYLELSDRVIRHEIAEELVVYPALAAEGPEAIYAHSGLDDHSQIEKLLVLLDRQEFGSSEFESSKVRLVVELLAHLAKEEEEVLPSLVSHLTNRRRAELADRFRQVTRVAPLLSAKSRARLQIGPTVVSRTSALAVWMRDVAHSTGLAG
jgi:hypothetical protein